MPGVPTSRGCDLCRKQKKKCDLAKPACTRCLRLNIPCIGSGHLRYKFKNQALVLKTNNSQAAQGPGRAIGRVSRALTNEATQTAGRFIFTIEVEDSRYDLGWYGDFLKDIPRRLGTNKALDAAVVALSTGCSSIRSREPPIEALAKYGLALKELRIRLQDPETACTPETLCAIYFMMICQSWQGKQDEDYRSHGEALTYILNQVATRSWRNDFGSDFLQKVCFVVISLRFINPRVQLGSWFWDMHMVHEPSSTNNPFESLKLHSIAKMPDFLNQPELKIDEIRSAYRQMQVDRLALRQYFLIVSERNSSSVKKSPSEAVAARKTFARTLSAYGILLGMKMAVNSILRILDPFDNFLIEESEMTFHEILVVAHQASAHRPLGVIYMPMCLIAAWTSTEDEFKQAKAKKLIDEYQSDFPCLNWMEMSFWLKTHLDRLRVRLSTFNQELASDDILTIEHPAEDELDEKTPGAGACCIM